MGSADPLENRWKIKNRKHAKKSIFQYFRMQNAPFRSQIFKIFFASGGKRALTPPTKILRKFLVTALICLHNHQSKKQLKVIYFASAAVCVDSSHMTASSSASWSRCSPPSCFVNGHVSTMWFMVCRWPQSQEGDWARPHFVQVSTTWTLKNENS